MTLVRDPDGCRRMSSAGLERVRSRFAWPRKAAQVVAIYRDLLGLPQLDELHSFQTQQSGCIYPELSDEMPSRA